MPSADSDAAGLAFSLRNAVVAVLCLFAVRLGAGWARGILEGDYVLGFAGLLLVLGPVLWLLARVRAAYF
ncbi:hypothetical protein ABSL23_00625 (plasmid) [Halobacterium sp. NMX12-1]|uniref:Uncharacterized protein n=1 Tax=Halobacterium sp. NMX12-1 TaxID=3166650 RepID=A0AAU8C907_9EURY